MEKWIFKNKYTIIGAVLGAIGGYLYYYFIGCSNGTCAITSKPMSSTLYGAVLFGLAFSIFESEKQQSV